MNRKQTELVLMRMAKTIAKVHNLNVVSVRDSDNGLWDNKGFTGLDMTLGEYFTSKYGRLQETSFTDVPIEEYDLRKDFKVEVGYKFKDPQISVGTQWGKDGYACVTFSGDENEMNYQMSDSQIFKESGIKYFRTIMSYWHQYRKEYGENPLDWKVEE